jgi:DNA-binding transcriptional regulator YiaG
MQQVAAVSSLITAIANSQKMNDDLRVTAPTHFAPLFRVALLALRLSKTKTASLLGVDKSLVGRWAAGTVRPTEHNLAKITQLIASEVPSFNMHDWHRDQDSFARLLGVDPDLVRASSDHPLLKALPLNCLAEAQSQTQRRGTTYEGFWRTTRPSYLMSGQLFHDYGMIRCGEMGLLEVSMGGAGLGFSGWALPLEGNLFAMLDGAVGFTPIFLVFRGVTLPKATMLDGIVLLAALDPGRTPAAMPILLERIGDLSGDLAKDDATCRELSGKDPFANEAEVPEDLRSHLIRDFGPEASVRGGDMFLAVSALRSLSRGSTPPGQLEG